MKFCFVLCSELRFGVDTDLVVFFFFFFKQKTAYEMRISDWSSDVCSSDLAILDLVPQPRLAQRLFDGGVELRLRSRQPVDARAISDILEDRFGEIGRASCRERVCQYV